jgi:hypothetical protein
MVMKSTNGRDHCGRTDHTMQEAEIFGLEIVEVDREKFDAEEQGTRCLWGYPCRCHVRDQPRGLSCSERLTKAEREHMPVRRLVDVEISLDACTPMYWACAYRRQDRDRFQPYAFTDDGFTGSKR